MDGHSWHIVIWWRSATDHHTEDKWHVMEWIWIVMHRLQRFSMEFIRSGLILDGLGREESVEFCEESAHAHRNGDWREDLLRVIISCFVGRMKHFECEYFHQHITGWSTEFHNRWVVLKRVEGDKVLERMLHVHLCVAPCFLRYLCSAEILLSCWVHSVLLKNDFCEISVKVMRFSEQKPLTFEWSQSVVRSSSKTVYLVCCLVSPFDRRWENVTHRKSFRDGFHLLSIVHTIGNNKLSEMRQK